MVKIPPKLRRILTLIGIALDIHSVVDFFRKVPSAIASGAGLVAIINWISSNVPTLTLVLFGVAAFSAVFPLWSVLSHFRARVPFKETHWSTEIDFKGLGKEDAQYAIDWYFSSFPESLKAIYKSLTPDLNGFEDHILFNFTVSNCSPYELQLTGETNGYPYFVGGGVRLSMQQSWNLTQQQSYGRIAPNTKMELAISLKLDLSLGAEFAYKDPDLNIQDEECVEFDFSEMAIGLAGTGAHADKKSCINFQSEICVKVPESPHHWARYREMYERLH